MPIGNPVTLTSNVASKTISATATASQTLFNVTGGYRINSLGVFKNGSRLQDGVDYIARDGLTVTLLSAASGGDKLQFVVFDTFRVAEAIRPAVDEQTIRGNLNVVGILSCTDLEGPVSLNITSGIQTFHDVRVGGALTVAGTLTYEDTTNSNVTGIATFSGGMNISGVGATATTLNVTGVSTFGDKVSIGDSIFHTGDINTSIRFPAADTFTVETGGSERLRVDSGGRLIVGADSAPSILAQVRLIVSGESLPNSSTVQVRYDDTTAGPAAVFANARGSTSSPAILQSGDEVGKIRFYGHDGNDFDNYAAAIQAEVDGAPGSNDMPGRLTFHTTTDGAASPTERLRIDSSGNVIVNGTATGSNAKFEVQSTTGSISSATLRITAEKTTTGAINTGSTIILAGHDGGNSRDFASLFAGKENGTGSNHDAYLAFGTRSNGSALAERLRITSAGNVGINETTPQQQLHVHDDTSYHGIFVNGNGAPRINFARSTTTTAEWSVGVDGTNGTRFAIADSAGNTAKLIIDVGGNANITGITTANQLFEGTTRVATTGKAIAMAMLFG